DVGRARVMELILSVIEANVCPGPRMAEPSGTCSDTARGRSSIAWASRVGGDVQVWVFQRRQVSRSGSGVQVREQRVVERLGASPRDFALGIIEIAEDNRAGGTGRLARGYNVAVAQRSIFAPRLDLPGADALDAVGALFHHAAAANRDVGIAH